MHTEKAFSVLLPERFGEPPCTFGTQLNVFSRESSAFRFQAFASFRKHHRVFGFYVYSIPVFNEKSTFV